MSLTKLKCVVITLKIAHSEVKLFLDFKGHPHYKDLIYKPIFHVLIYARFVFAPIEHFKPHHHSFGNYMRVQEKCRLFIKSAEHEGVTFIQNSKDQFSSLRTVQKRGSSVHSGINKTVSYSHGVLQRRYPERVARNRKFSKHFPNFVIFVLLLQTPEENRDQCHKDRSRTARRSMRVSFTI